MLFFAVDDRQLHVFLVKYYLNLYVNWVWINKYIATERGRSFSFPWLGSFFTCCRDLLADEGEDDNSQEHRQRIPALPIIILLVLVVLCCRLYY